MECDASRDGKEAQPGTQEAGDSGEEPDHPDIPRVPDVPAWASGVNLVAAIGLDSPDVGEERVRHHRDQRQRVRTEPERGGQASTSAPCYGFEYGLGIVKVTSVLRAVYQ
jgi:hypothetical protein